MIWIALSYAVVGFTWINFMVLPGGIFDGLPPLFQDKCGDSRIPNKLFHVLFLCEKCFAGQLAFWTYYPLAVPYQNIRYDMLDHFLVIILSIFFAGFINRLYLRLS